MSHLRVVNLGLPKTGTTTLARALRRAGMKTADHRIRDEQTDDATLHGAYVADLLYKGYFETGDPGAYLTEFSALSEISLLRDGQSLWPQMDLALLRAIKAHHPEVRFLASMRDAFKLSQSMLAWSDLGTARLPQSAIPGLPQGYGDTTKERVQWIEGHYATLEAVFGDDPNFFAFSIEGDDVRERLSEFLGVKLPWWGHINRNEMSEA